MKILVLNAGSSSIKFQLFEMPTQVVLAKGLIQRIGETTASLRFESKYKNVDKVLSIKNHKDGLEMIAKLLLDPSSQLMESANELMAVGHRVVHGGSSFVEPTVITESVKDTIRALFPIAPLHNPANLLGVEVAEKVFPCANQIAVFDTAFHQTIPEVAHRYAIPEGLYKNEKIRSYGFHGTSHQYVSRNLIQINPDLKKIISIHLGNGCSVTAIMNGQSIDHSLGFGPMNGLIMGTRSGDIDQSVVLYLQRSLGYSLDEIANLLQKQSGMLGLTGMSDLRDIEQAAANGDTTCQMALEMNAYRIKKFIGSYTAIMNGLDAIIFTAGIGENSSSLRRQVCVEMDYLGLQLDEDRNQIKSKEPIMISKDTSSVELWVVPTNEELEIALQVEKLLL